MAHVLIGWELGANRGHIETIQRIAKRLLAEGHDVAIALQRVDGAGLERDPRLSLWQAPVWPRLLGNVAPTALPDPQTMGDILARLGVGEPGTLSAMIAGWDAILGAGKPDVVIADFAPALLCAARGRLASISVGTGFQQVPSQLARFPSLTGKAASFDESGLLDTVDAELHAAGRSALSTLPGMFAATHELVASFAELDPYRQHRQGDWSAPSVRLPVPVPEDQGGDGIFVYGYVGIPMISPLWDGLAATGRRVQVYIPDLSADYVRRLTGLGLTVLPKPLPLSEIAARSRLTVSHGGLGFVSSCLLVGLPQVVLSYDLEKRATGAAINALELGVTCDLPTLDARIFADQVNSVWADTALAAKARQAAPDFARRMAVTVEDEIGAVVAEL
jgi:rhamnosyltransferase subunit B